MTLKRLVPLIMMVGLQSQAENSPTFRSVKQTSSDTGFYSSPTPTQLAADSLGSTFWAGGFSGPVQSVGSLSFTNSNSDYAFEGFILKLGPTMDERWARYGGGPGNQIVTGLAVDAN